MKNHQPTPSEVLRFWKKVSMKDGCWEWTGKRNGDGYGKFTYDGGRKFAHRFSYMIHFGSIPKGNVVCHKCDNPCCVRPDHLFVGTQIDNMLDRSVKGRTSWAKVTKDQVIQIREEYANLAATMGDLAKKYNLETGTVQAIVTGRNWQWVGGRITNGNVARKSRPGPCRGENGATAKLSNAEVFKIRETVALGVESQYAIAKRHGVCQAAISNIVKGKTFQDVGGPIKQSKCHYQESKNATPPARLPV